MENKKWILYFGGFELPDKNAAAQRASSVAKSFRELGYNVALSGVSKDRLGQDEIIKSKNSLEDFERVTRLYPANLKEWIEYIVSSKKEIGIIEGYSNIAAVICYDYPSLTIWQLNKYCKDKGIKFIVDIAEWYGPSKKIFPLNIIKNMDTSLRMKYVLPKLDNIICISKFLYDYYRKQVENCILVPGTIDKGDEKWLESMAYIPNSIFTLGYAGNPGPKCEKERIDLLIAAVCELNEEGFKCRIDLAGFQKSNFEKDYPEILEKPNYKDVINYLGRLPHKDCIKLIKRVDFSIIAREDNRITRAGFPTKLSESFGCGTPVITTPSGNVADYVVKGENGFVTEGFSYEKIKESIKNSINLSKEKLLEMHRLTAKNNPLDYRRFNEELKKIMD